MPAARGCILYYIQPAAGAAGDACCARRLTSSSCRRRSASACPTRPGLGPLRVALERACIRVASVRHPSRVGQCCSRVATVCGIRVATVLDICEECRQPHPPGDSPTSPSSLSNIYSRRYRSFDQAERQRGAPSRAAPFSPRRICSRRF